MNESRYDMSDFVVLLPGILGSTLSQDGKLVWAPSAGAVLRAVRTAGGSLKRLRLPEGIGDDHPGDGVQPVDVMPDLHILPGIWTAHVGYDKLLKWLESTFGMVRVTPDGPVGNLLPVPYDWRLSNRYNGRRLKEVVEPALRRWREQGGRLADARVVFICHSMGGLVARWYIQREGGAEVTRKLITLGTPHRGALNALEQLINGVRKGPWPFRIDLTEFVRSLPSIHQLLPEYACVESSNGLLKTTETVLPEVTTRLVDDGMQYYGELNETSNPSWETGFDLHPVLGQKQSTATTARLSNGKLIPEPTINGGNERGDATVPALSAVPATLRPTSPIVRYVTERHGALQSNPTVFDELEGILTASAVVHRAGSDVPVDVHVDEVFDFGTELSVRAEFPDGAIEPLEARLVDEMGNVLDRERFEKRDGAVGVTFDPPAPGAYEIQVAGYGSARDHVTEVTAPVLVWEPER